MSPSRNVEWWSHGLSVPRWSAREAVEVEKLGFTGLTFNDSQCLGADPYVTMMSAAAVTSSLRLATSVTNPVTRHPSVTAAAAATLQAETKGRITLGIGRGDSALAHLALAPASVELLEEYVVAVQRYLSGLPIEFDDLPTASEQVRHVSSLHMKGTPDYSKLEWLRPEVLKVPVTVTATGPRVISVGARHADGINFAVGADTERVAWAISIARQALKECGRTKDVDLGAYVSVLVEEDKDLARSLVAGEVASFARFSAMHGQPVGPKSADDAHVLSALHDRYDMKHHFQYGSPQSEVLPAAFIDRYAIVGSPGYCVDRLKALVELGITRFMVSTTPGGLDRQISARFRSRFAAEVLPNVVV